MAWSLPVGWLRGVRIRLGGGGPGRWRRADPNYTVELITQPLQRGLRTSLSTVGRAADLGCGEN